MYVVGVETATPKLGAHSDNYIEHFRVKCHKAVNSNWANGSEPT